jgi:hypothetical protein
MSDDREHIETPSIRRRGTIDYMRSAGRRSNMHGLVEFDVTEARRRSTASAGAFRGSSER